LHLSDVSHETCPTMPSIYAHVGLLALLVALTAACSPTPTPEELLARARQALESGDLNAAVIDAKSALQQDAGNAEGRRLLGVVYYQQRQLRPAIAEFERSLAVSPDPAVAALYAKALVASGESEGLVRMHKQGDFGFARNNVNYMATLARAQAISGDLAAAEQTLGLARELASDSPALLLAEAVYILRSTADLEQTVSALELLTARYPDYEDGWSMQGSVALTQLELEQAESAFARTVELNPNRTNERLLLINLLLDRGATELAAELLRPAATTAPRHPGVLYARARLLLAQDQSRAALDLLQQVLATDADHYPSLYLAGVANAREGNLDTALLQLTRFLSAQPGHENARLLQASVHLQLGETTPARVIARDMLEEHPEHVVARQILAASADGSGVLVEVAQAAVGTHVLTGELEGVSLASLRDDIPKLHLEAAIYLARGENESARGLYEHLIALVPDDAVALNNLAWIHRDQNPEQALALVERALRAAPGHAGVLDTKAMILLHQERFAEALEVNQQSLDATPVKPVYRFHRAQIMAAQGNLDAARDVLELLLREHVEFEGREQAEELSLELGQNAESQ
jgi:tetratricopeptide (TPR) repeat protein